MSHGIRLVGGLTISPGATGEVLWQEEGVDVAERGIANFIGATVTVADDAPNNRVNITIVGTLQAAYDGGETITEDAQGAIDITRGALAPDGEPALTIVDANANPGRTAHLLSFTDTNVEGATTADIYVSRTAASGALGMWLDRNGTAAVSAGTERDSSRFRWTASMFDGAVNQERDFDLYAFTPALSEAVAGGRARLRLEYEGTSLLELSTSGAATPAADVGCTIRNRKPVGGTNAAFTLQATAAYGLNNAIFRINTNDDDTLATGTVFEAGDGYMRGSRIDNVATGYFLEMYLSRGGISAVANDVAGTIRFQANDSLVTRESFAEITGIVLDPTNGSEDGEIAIWSRGAGTLLQSMTVGAIRTRLDSLSAGALGYELELYQDSASPAASDIVGVVSFYGEDSGSGKTEYAEIDGVIEIATAAAEYGRVDIRLMNNGTLGTALQIRADGGGANSGGIFSNPKAAGAAPAIRFRAVSLFLSTQRFITFENNDGNLEPLSVLGQGDVRMTSTDAGALGPELRLYQDSASPAVNDDVGIITFQGESSTSVQVEYGRIRGRIVDTTNASEDATIDLLAMVAGASTLGLSVGSTGAAIGIGFLGAAAAARQTGGANLTNNVTAGGVNDTIADFAVTVGDGVAGASLVDLTTVANQADVEARLASIRDDIHQLARTVKQDHDALRLYGLLT